MIENSHVLTVTTSSPMAASSSTNIRTATHNGMFCSSLSPGGLAAKGTAKYKSHIAAFFVALVRFMWFVCEKQVGIAGQSGCQGYGPQCGHGGQQTMGQASLTAGRPG